VAYNVILRGLISSAFRSTIAGKLCGRCEQLRRYTVVTRPAFRELPGCDASGQRSHVPGKPEGKSTLTPPRDCDPARTFRRITPRLATYRVGSRNLERILTSIPQICPLSSLWYASPTPNYFCAHLPQPGGFTNGGFLHQNRMMDMAENGSVNKSSAGRGRRKRSPSG